MINHEQLKNQSLAYWRMREWYVRGKIFLSRLFDVPRKKKPRILFYHLTGLGYGGTETFLQLLAKYTDKDKFDVYYMYGDQQVSQDGVEDYTSRLATLLEGHVCPIRFEYKRLDMQLPYIVHGMSPNFFQVLKDFQIDVLVTAGSGHASFPFSAVTNIPIIFVNVFGQPNMQKNIAYHLCISQEVAGKLRGFVPQEKIKVSYVPSEFPDMQAQERGRKLRKSLDIPDDALVFGRIGRNSNDIYDPIGITAFSEVVKKHPDVHYLIVSPSEDLKKFVVEKNIPHVHFIPASGNLQNLWAFYYAMDILAHFRKDGESFGLNIAQAMLCGRPVISHRSRLWNAHLEYLTPDFSRVAEIDRADQYKEYMEWFITEWQKGRLATLGLIACEKAKQLVSIPKHAANFDEYISGLLRKV